MKCIFSLSNLILVIGLFLGSCQRDNIHTSGIIKEQFYLQNGDSKMQVYVEGNITPKKIVITVHGGPGDGSLYLNVGEVNNIAEKQLAIAYWDQRLSGSSQGNKQDKSLNSYVDDLKKLIILLKSRYGTDTKVYLLAHSWGGMIAPKFLEVPENQNMVEGWIQVDGAHNYPLNDSLSRWDLVNFGNQEIAAGRNKDQWTEIVNYCSQSDPKNDRKVAKKINTYTHETDDLIAAVNPESPTTKERIKFLTKEYHYPLTTFLVNGIYNNIVGNVEDQAYQENIAARLNSITKPGLFLWGKYDFVCPTGLMNEISSKISSTDVTTKIFQNSGHNPMFNEPVLFWTTVTGWVLAH